MSTSPLYCAYCGAANTADNPLCFSCQRPLTLPTENEQVTLLNERYQLLTQVGVGGFGGVYRALDKADGSCVVAVKQIHLRDLSPKEIIDATDSFNREVRLLSQLHHPHLPTIRDTFTDPDHWYVVMDYIEGETVEEYMQYKAHPGLPLQEVVALGTQLCDVLHHLHTRTPPIIFRDLKPSNVMRTADGTIYLIDFGIARHFTPGKPKDTIPFGSPGYAAPEQYGRTQTTPQADLYSLGALLHYMLTGQDPAETPFHFAPLPMADSTALATLDTLIQRMVATEPELRPANALEVKTTLQHVANDGWYITLAEASRLRPAPPPVATPPTPTGFTRRDLLTGIAKLGVTAAGIGGALTLCTVAINHLHPYPSGFAGIAVVQFTPGVMKSQFVYRGHTGAITALSWSPDGQYVASGSIDKTVQVWRAADGALLYTLMGYDEPVTSIVWATDRTNVIASSGMSDGTVQIWDALRDHRDLIYQGDGRVLALDWQKVTPWMVSGGTSNEIYTWNADTGKKGTSYRGHTGDVRAVAWIAAPDPFFTPASNLTPTSNNSTPIPSSPTFGSQVASGGADGTVQIWDANTGSHVSTYTGHQAGINGLALLYSDRDSNFHPTQYNRLIRIISASDDGTVQSWSPEVPSRSSIYRGHSGKVNAVAMLYDLLTSHDGSEVVISAGEDHTVQVWSLGTQHLLHTYTEHQAPVRAVATSPVPKDHRIVSGDADGLVHLWTISDATT